MHRVLLCLILLIHRCVINVIYILMLFQRWFPALVKSSGYHSTSEVTLIKGGNSFELIHNKTEQIADRWHVFDNVLCATRTTINSEQINIINGIIYSTHGRNKASVFTILSVNIVWPLSCWERRLPGGHRHWRAVQLWRHGLSVWRKRCFQHAVRTPSFSNGNERHRPASIPLAQ